MGKILNKIDDVREAIEDVIADVLLKIDKNTAVDDLQKEIIKTAFEKGLQAFGYEIDSEKLNLIVDPIVDVGLKKINGKVQKQLRKKNKKWKKRHEQKNIEE